VWILLYGARERCHCVKQRFPTFLILPLLLEAPLKERRLHITVVEAEYLHITVAILLEAPLEAECCSRHFKKQSTYTLGLLLHYCSYWGFDR